LKETPSVFDVIAFDGDDTLWHNESLYAAAQAEFRRLLAKHHPAEVVDRGLYETEMRNLEFYGYGIKSFTLSMIETAIELTNGQVTAEEVREILGIGRRMLTADVRLLEYAQSTVAQLASSHTLMLITKGDLRDQKRKLAKSGLAPYFHHIEIVTDKTREEYAEILDKYQIRPERFLMVGDSLRSDVQPVLDLGGQVVHIPYHVAWAHEVLDVECVGPGCHRLEDISLLPKLVEEIEKGS
jgi:putative hydrolase of the HAD superfamily